MAAKSVNQHVDALTNENADQKGNYGAASVGDGVAGFLKSRRLTLAATHPGVDVAGANTNARTWTAAENARKVIVLATYVGAAVTTTDDYVDLVLDAPNGTVAKAFLDATPTAHAVDEAFLTIRIPVGVRVELPIAPLGSPYLRIDARPTVAMNLLVEAY